MSFQHDLSCRNFLSSTSCCACLTGLSHFNMPSVADLLIASESITRMKSERQYSFLYE